MWELEWSDIKSTIHDGPQQFIRLEQPHFSVEKSAWIAQVWTLRQIIFVTVIENQQKRPKQKGTLNCKGSSPGAWSTPEAVGVLSSLI